MKFDRVPTRRDPRWRFLALLASYVVFGITFLGFNRSPLQILMVVSATCGLDMLFHHVARGRKDRTVLFPLSSMISGFGLGILVNYAHGPWLLFVPVFFSVASKYVLTFKGRHVFNPTLIGVTLSLLLGEGMISASPSYQWGGSLAICFFIVGAALSLFIREVRRVPLTLAFLGFYFVGLAIRAYVIRYHVPTETLFLGALTAPAFFLFTYFMLTDPKTSPPTARGQVLMAFVIVGLDLWLHKMHRLSTLFLAGSMYFAGRFVWLHVAELVKDPRGVGPRLSRWAPRPLTAAAIAALGLVVHAGFIRPKQDAEAHVAMTAQAADAVGIAARPSDALSLVDPRIAHVAKWLLSIGDAVASADVDLDGRQDLFFTLPLKQAEDRGALYLNRGHFKFERVEIPELALLVAEPRTHGFPAGAVFFDADNDGDQDLLVLFAWGESRLFRNRLLEDGKLSFAAESGPSALRDYTVSVAATVVDLNRDGKLDVFLANVLPTTLPAYDQPTRFDIFRLPQPAHEGDRRMFDFMHRTWYDAANGGDKWIYMNEGASFARQKAAERETFGTRWTLAVGAADLNRDGSPELYLANDFGPDQLFQNDGKGRFAAVRGSFIGEMGRDTYKGMNVSIGDVDGNGHQDLYVSNVHKPLQAEGSLLWMNDGTMATAGAAAFTDRASGRNALNERRFGWGAAMGDLDLDGKLDLAQANGMVNDRYDRTAAEGQPCDDYWYYAEKVALTNPDVHGFADRWADLRGRCIFPADANRLYLNRDRYFVDVAASVGFDLPKDAQGKPSGPSRAVAMVDLDEDGDLDLVVTHQFSGPSFFENGTAQADGPHWVGLALEGDGRRCNRDAIGTVARVQDGAYPEQMREVQAVSGFSAQGDRRILFGLGGKGGASREVAVRVKWCGDGPEQALLLPTRQYHRIRQPRVSEPMAGTP